MNTLCSNTAVFPSGVKTSPSGSTFTTDDVEWHVSTPSLEEVIVHNGCLPEEALFLGQAEDDQPVLLDLYDPSSGPLLIVGREGAGKTQFLRSIAQFVISTHSPQEIQFGVITNRMEEWQNGLTGYPHCVGIFSSSCMDARQLVQCLEMWTRSSERSGQSVLLLVDGVEELQQWDQRSRECLDTVLSRGPEKRVWTIATMHPKYFKESVGWLSALPIRFFEHALAWNCTYPELNIPRLAWDIPVHGTWFLVKEKTGWLRFWIPSVNE